MHCKPVFAFILLLPAPALAQIPGGEAEPYVVTCRPPQVIPGSRLRGPEVCKTNQVWAQYAKDGMTVSADGSHDVPSEKLRTIRPLACRAATAGGTGAVQMSQVNFGLVCE